MGLFDLLRRRSGNQGRKCPACGNSYARDVQFCPRDGATLDDKATTYDGFISYRRENGAHAAQVIRLMVEKLSGKKLFLDVDELGAGRFDERLLEIIENAPAVILILSPNCLERCRNPDDRLAREITHAFEHKKTFIPVMVDGFTFPDAAFMASLPPALAALPNYQAVPYDPRYAEASARKILAYMIQPPEGGGVEARPGCAEPGAGKASAQPEPPRPSTAKPNAERTASDANSRPEPSRPNTARRQYHRALGQQQVAGTLATSRVACCTCNPVSVCAPITVSASSGAPVKGVWVPVGVSTSRDYHPVAAGSQEPKVAQLKASDAIELLRQHRDDAKVGKTTLADQGDGDHVECSVFAPPEAGIGEDLLVQVFAHCPEQSAEAAVLARQFDPDSTKRGFRTLERIIPRGTPLAFHLEIPTLVVDEPIQTLIWSGRAESVQFAVSVPPGRRQGTAIGTVIVSVRSVPVGHIKFILKVSMEQAREPRPVPLGDQAQTYSMAFISYAAADRARVIPRVQMLRAMGIDFFQDVLDLEPGARWEQKLYGHIDACDLFLLFWSSAAKDSEWVMREVTYALKRKGGDDLAPPEIRPVIIEGPPIVPPPQILSHLHFNDSLAYFLAAEVQAGATR